MSEHKQLKVLLEEELQELHDARDELLLEAQLADADVRNEWNRVDFELRAVSTQINRVDDQPDGSNAEVEAAARKLLDQVRARIGTLGHRHWPARTASTT